jgi:hypothetical protein
MNFVSEVLEKVSSMKMTEEENKYGDQKVMQFFFENKRLMRNKKLAFLSLCG